MSPRQYWDSPTPSLATEGATYPGTKGRAFSPASEGLGKSQFRRLEKKFSTLPTLCGIGWPAFAQIGILESIAL